MNQPQLRPMTRDEVREIDRRTIGEFGLPGVVLMENAGRGATDVLLSLGNLSPVLILAGKGNNGGDGYVVARFLQLHGVECRIASTVKLDALTGDAAIQMSVAQAAGIEIVVEPTVAELRELVGSARCIVDAMIGTGGSGALRAPMSEWAALVNKSDAVVVAIDVPTGLDCDAGTADENCVRADHTVTFVSTKIGFATQTARECLGEVHVVPIGAPLMVLEPFIA